MGTLSGDVMRLAPRLGPRLVHASSSCGANGRFAVGAAGALKDFPVCQRATQAMSVVTLVRGWVLARHTARNSTAPERRTERRTSEREVHDADSNPRSAPHRLQCARRPGHRYDEISSVKLVAGHLRIDDQLEGVELVAGAQPFERAVPLGGERR